MALLTTLRKDKMEALKAKDHVKNGVCSLLISAIALAEKEAGQPVKRRRRAGLCSERTEADKGRAGADAGQPRGSDRGNAA